MKLTATGGTDGANIVLFWPDLLPEDGDQQLKDDPIALVEQLEQAGRIVWFPCDADGGYSLAAFVDEPLPAELARFCSEAKRAPSLTIRGIGYFGGIEYLFRRDRGFLDKYPAMATPVEIPAGIYVSTVYTCEVPDEVEARWMAEHVDARTRHRVRTADLLVVAAGIAVIATILVGLGRVSTVAWALPAIASALFIAAVRAVNGPSYRMVSSAREQFERDYPTYVLQLTTSRAEDAAT